jgi:hypothetical protein
MTSDPLPAHSLAEAYMYLMATPCPNCGKGPLHGDDARPTPETNRVLLTVPTQCGACSHWQDFVFSVEGDLLSVQAQQAAGIGVRVNASHHASRIIDVAQWILLFRMISEAAARVEDKQDTRLLGYEAAQCLEEALKFYGADNDLPPDRALFHESSRQRRRDYPQEFSRERLIELRAKLPTLEVMEASRFVSRKEKKRWWAPWR